MTIAPSITRKADVSKIALPRTYHTHDISYLHACPILSIKGPWPNPKPQETEEKKWGEREKEKTWAQHCQQDLNHKGNITPYPARQHAAQYRAVQYRIPHHTTRCSRPSGTALRKTSDPAISLITRSLHRQNKKANQIGGKKKGKKPSTHWHQKAVGENEKKTLHSHPLQGCFEEKKEKKKRKEKNPFPSWLANGAVQYYTVANNPFQRRQGTTAPSTFPSKKYSETRVRKIDAKNPCISQTHNPHFRILSAWDKYLYYYCGRCDYEISARVSANSTSTLHASKTKPEDGQCTRRQGICI